MFSGPLKAKTEEEKVSYLLLWVGVKGRDIRHTWTDISADDAKKLATGRPLYTCIYRRIGRVQ